MRPAEDAFASSFEPLQLGGGCVGGAVGVVFVPPGGQIAVEPTLLARWSQTTLAIADEPTTRDGDADGFELRTYSTQQVTLTILGQLTFRITIAPQR